MSPTVPVPSTPASPRGSLILLGHNGAGKSTLIRWLLGFYPDNSQHPFLQAWNEITPLDLNGLGFVPELPYLDLNLTGGDQFRLFSRLKGVSLSHHEMCELLDRTGLEHKVLSWPVRKYSKGMKQRLMLSIALIGKPQTLLLDEPLSGLDPFGHQQIIELLISLKTECRLILSTHNLQDAWILGDEIWLLQQGQFVYQGAKPDTREALDMLYFDHPPLTSAT